jgi:HEAT repeat protein
MDIQESLKILKAWNEKTLEIDYNIVWSISHDLADVQNPVAKDIFVQGLDDSNWRWREDSISLLGFHYPLEDNVLKKIRNMLLIDPSANVRIACVYVLARRSSLPDPALLSALRSDPNHLVRESAFEAILSLAGVSYTRIKHEIKRIKMGELEPELTEIKRIVMEERIKLSEHLFDQYT